jgi:NarL family two-component system response regulator LiaR
LNGLMVEGLSNNEIADRLVVAQPTVKFHVSNILSKLGVDSRTEAVILAMKRHLVD